MFTGLIQGVAEVFSVEKKINLSTYVIKMPLNLLSGLEVGSSVSCNGCCLTVIAMEDDKISFDLLKETLRLTNLSLLQVGEKVNIERAARFSDEIGGHLISGHILMTAIIIKICSVDNFYQIWFKIEDCSQIKYIFYKGFIAIDGISLTVGKVRKTTFCAHLIPETLLRTTLGLKLPGQRVNIEIDLNTKSIVDTVERFLMFQQNIRSSYFNE
ncbi:riboflavin synthase subunit alpha [Candidatus Erwinia haradaeae]|uniref:Riboflavin synthase n=1 Tax=Candidatus Erwinia haradaeae TaxID=1922217 RepID=A0A803FUJ9_9GAMM|nr:riboflavin synthase subunit alpha [Candidatus Erwinia haradaeae]VFP88833.1 Riboflavin synthase [Candidatus Erwinia haradaeae]